MLTERQLALARARQKRCYERHRAERLAYQKSYYDQKSESIRQKTKLRRIYGDEWRSHYESDEGTEGGLNMSEIEKKWPGWKVITNENVVCKKCGKRIESGVLAHCSADESDMVCEVCYGQLRDEAAKMGRM